LVDTETLTTGLPGLGVLVGAGVKAWVGVCVAGRGEFVTEGEIPRVGVGSGVVCAPAAVSVGAAVFWGNEEKLLAKATVGGFSDVGVKVALGRKGVRVEVPLSIPFGVG
jgi:hypothetical protein